MRPFAKLGFGGGGGDRANAVNFDGTNDFLRLAGDFTGNPDGKAGTFSAWIDLTGGDAASQVIFQKHNITPVNRFIIDRTTGDVFRVRGLNAAGTLILSMTSTGTYTASSGWVHLLIAFNLATPVARLFVNGADDEAGGSTETNDTIDFATGDGNWNISVNAGSGEKMTADVADLWFDDSFIDISTEANRRLFIDPNGKPVNLGEAGQFPTGSSPLVFLSGPTANWHTNKGTGGGFTENGALTDGSSSPSD